MRATSLALIATALVGCGADPDIVVGSKKFTENVLLGHMATQLMADRGLSVEHKNELGGTRILWNSLLEGELDIYPEYTGTLREEILHNKDVDTDEKLQKELARQGLLMSKPIGFNDGYAIGMRQDEAAKRNITKVSDLRAHPDLRLGLGHEFLDRDDGWPSLKMRYRLPHKNIRGLDHDLAYRALESGSIDAMDIYTTDPQIPHYNLRVLEDDLHHFPSYHAILVYRADLADRFPEAVEALRRMEGLINEKQMIAMNSRAMVDRVHGPTVTADFLFESLDIVAKVENPSRLSRILDRTWEHLFLVVVSLLAAVLVSIPLGIFCAAKPRAGQIVLGVVEAIQTIPSMALLVLFIPLFGIGALPALAAMFLYSLLPIVRSTATGLMDVPPGLRESAAALGLPPAARLRLVELPMSARAILAGIKTSSVWNVATATIGALIGARGYGQPILTGIRLDDTSMILEGAIPAALMALAFRVMFEIIERAVVPRGLRIRPAG